MREGTPSVTAQRVAAHRLLADRMATIEATVATITSEVTGGGG